MLGSLSSHPPIVAAYPAAAAAAQSLRRRLPASLRSKGLRGGPSAAVLPEESGFGDGCGRHLSIQTLECPSRSAGIHRNIKTVHLEARAWQAGPQYFIGSSFKFNQLKNISSNPSGGDGSCRAQCFCCPCLE